MIRHRFLALLVALLRRSRFYVLLFCVMAAIFWVLRSHGNDHRVAYRHRDQQDAHNRAFKSADPSDDFSVSAKSVWCRINAQSMANVGWSGRKADPVKCLMARSDVDGEDEDEEEAFVPFSFVKKYFDIYGELKRLTNKTWLEWEHSYSRVFPQFGSGRYFFNGTFLQFADFDVEMRSRVMCVTASEGVPISTQWDKAGYYYSTQISQFALSHWSKAVVLREIESGLSRNHHVKRLGGRNRQTLEDGVDVEGDWRGDVTRVTSLQCVHFDPTSSASLSLSGVLDHGGSSAEKSKSDPEMRVLSWAMQYRQDAVVSVTLKTNSLAYVLKYAPEDFHVKRDGNVVTYGYGSDLAEGSWKSFSRDLMLDLQKGLAKKAFGAFKRGGPVKLSEMRLEGEGCITNVTLSEQEHVRMFFSAADWLVKSQDGDGGWPVDVVFNADRSKYGGAEELPPGWRSAMASGHALSVLARAYSASIKSDYLQRAFAALTLFDTPSSQGGFQATFMNKYVWYEEYPTRPSTFVLNGFMYSLMGLFDLKDALEVHELTSYEQYKTVSRLYNSGIASLRAMLPLYDTGSGTLYDLRHFTGAGLTQEASPSSPPKPARWDYHATHVNLLYTLSTAVDNAETKAFFAETARRWQGYMLGRRAEHN